MDLGKALIRDLLRTHASVERAVRALGAVQIDPVQVVGRNHEIALAHRVRDWSPEHLRAALTQGRLVEVYAQARCFVPVEDLPLHWWRFAVARKAYEPYFRKHRKDVDDLLAILDERGPVGPRDLKGPRVEKRHEWASGNLYTMLLELLWRAGRVAIAERRGNEKRYVRIERAVPERYLDEAAHARDRDDLELRRVERYVQAVRLAHLREPHFGFSDLRAAEKMRILSRLVEEGRIVPPPDPQLAGRYVASPDFAARAARGKPLAPTLLSPLDNLLWSRQRLEDLWGLRYRWEIYHPQHKRTTSPYAMVLVADDRVLGQVAVQSDRKTGRLIVRRFTPAAGVEPPAARDALRAAADGLCRVLELDRCRFETRLRKRAP